MEIDVADITLSEVVDGQVRVQLGDLATGTAIGQNYPQWGMSGFYSVPPAPDKDAAAQCVFIWDDNAKLILGVRDNRHSAFVGNMEPGDTAMVSGNARIFGKAADGMVAMYSITPDNKSMLCSLDGSTGEINLNVNGTSITVADGRITLAAGGTSLEIDSEGVQIHGPYIGLNSGGGNIGAAGPPGTQLPPLTTHAVAYSAVPQVSTGWTVGI